MLEQLIDSKSRARRRLGPAVSLSIAVHGAAVVGLLIAAAWQVDKLETADTPVVIAAGFAVPLVAVPEGPKRPDPPKSRTKRPSTLSQPGTKKVDQPDKRIEGDDRDTRETGPITGEVPLAPCPPGSDCSAIGQVPVAQPVCGDGQLDAGEECDDGARAPGDGCSPTCRREKQLVVPPRLIEGHRIAGDPQIPAPDSVRSQMIRKNERSVTGTVKMCLGADGTVRSLELLRSTGYPEYDARLTSRMETWRYRPYRLDDGTPVALCTPVTFIYRMQ